MKPHKINKDNSRYFVLPFYINDEFCFTDNDGNVDDDLEDGEKIIIGADYSEVLGIFHKFSNGTKRISLSHWSGPYKYPAYYKRLYPKGDQRGSIHSCSDQTLSEVETLSEKGMNDN